MTHAVTGRLALLVAMLLTFAGPVLAQEAAGYDDPVLGVTFDLPPGWQVEADRQTVTLGAPEDLAALRDGEPPRGPTLRLTFGTFSQLRITDADQFPDLLARLVPSSVTSPAPQPVTWGNARGYAAEATPPGDETTTRVALLAVAGGRVAVLRALAPAARWNEAQGAFDVVLQSLHFRVPARDAALVATIDTDDGGILWQYQAPPPADGRAVRAGGIIYDMFDVLYMAAGPGGVLSLNLRDGSAVAFMGPWYEGQYVDIAIGPRTLLFLANAAPDTREAISVVDRAGNWGRGWGTRGDGEGQFAPAMPQTIAVTPAGDVWTVSEGHASGVARRLYRFDAWGTLLQTVDLAAVHPELANVRIAYSPASEALYLAGASGGLSVVDAEGAPLVVDLAQEVLQDLTPRDIATTADGSVVLALQASGLDGFGFIELSPGGRLLDAFGIPYDAARGGEFLPGEYHAPAGLIVAPGGSVVWTETHPETGLTQVQRFSFTGDGSLPMASNDHPELTAMVGSNDPALGGGSIAYGQSVHGALNNQHPVHTWTFEGRAGDHVQIRLVDASGTGALDPHLRLKTQDGREIAANDDVGDVRPPGLERRDAYIDFFLPSSGVFNIEVGRFGGRGDYVLTLEVVTATEAP